MFVTVEHITGIKVRINLDHLIAVNAERVYTLTGGIQGQLTVEGFDTLNQAIDLLDPSAALTTPQAQDIFTDYLGSSLPDYYKEHNRKVRGLCKVCGENPGNFGGECNESLKEDPNPVSPPVVDPETSASQVYFWRGGFY